MVSTSSPKKSFKSVQTCWIIDLGCTHHMCTSMDFLRPGSIKAIPFGKNVYLANGKTSRITHEGYVDLQLSVPGRKVTKSQLAGVLVISGLLKNIISVFALLDKGVDVHFDGRAKMCYLKDGLVLLARPHCRMDRVNFPNSLTSHPPFTLCLSCKRTFTFRWRGQHSIWAEGEPALLIYPHPMAAKLNFADMVVATCQAFMGPFRPVYTSRFTGVKKIVRPSQHTTSTFVGNQSPSSQGPSFFKC